MRELSWYVIAREEQVRLFQSQHYGIAQEDLLEDLEQVGVLEEVGMTLERWALLRDVPMEYALALREYLDQEKQEANQKGTQAVGHRAT